MTGVFALAVFAAVPAHAEISGWAEWGYLDYTAEQGGGTVQEARHFTQDYSLYYQTSGYLAEGRAGKYDVGLGYQWTSLSSEVDGTDNDIDTGKILYRGEFLLAPGGLPFRLHAFSYDLSPTQVQYSEQQLSILEPMVATDVMNGQRTVTGMTFIAGIRNGTYLGEYRELLSKYPRLLVDYKEDNVRDLESSSPQHYRFRDLAFVSLNKKDNWFHYRLHEFTDYLDPSNDFIEKQYVIGTVDHVLRRQWINLTNWIKISVDASLTVTDEADSKQGELFQVNLFEQMSRRQFSISNFNSFRRERGEDELSKTYDIPFYADGIIDPNRTWRAAFIAYGEEETLRKTSLEEGSYLSGSLLIGERDRLRYQPTLEIESKRGDRGEGEAASFAFEVSTNQQYRPEIAKLGRYRATWLSGETSEGGQVDYLEQELTGEIVWQRLAGWQVGARQRFLYGQGELETGVTRFITALGNEGLLGSSQREDRLDGTLLRSTSELYGTYVFTPALKNRLGLTFDYRNSDSSESESLLILEQELDYEKPTVRASLFNQLSVGENPQSTSTTSSIDTQRSRAVGSVGEVDYTYYHSSKARYRPTRSFEASGRIDFDWQHGKLGDTQHLVLSQDLNYTIYSVNGFVRKLAELYQTYQHEQFYAEDGDIGEVEFTLGANYYVTRVLRLGARTSYVAYDPEGIEEIELRGLVGVDYAKLQCEVSYSYGLGRDDDGLVEDRKEHLFEARVRKIF